MTRSQGTQITSEPPTGMYAQLSSQSQRRMRENRYTDETAELIRKQSSDSFVEPSRRYLAAVQFDERVRRDFDTAILLTCISARINYVIESSYPGWQLVQSTKRLAIRARSQESASAVRDVAVRTTILVPEPDRWREVRPHSAGRLERSSATQEYTRSDRELTEGLRSHGAGGLPQDTGHLWEAAQRGATSQLPGRDYLFKIAALEAVEDTLRDLSKRAVSVGRDAIDALEEFSVHSDLTSTRSKETFEQVLSILQRKRS